MDNPRAVSQELLQRGLSLHRAGLLAEAEAAYRQVLRSNPGHFDVMVMLAFVCFQRADYGAALREIDRVLKLRPGEAGAHFNRALALQKLGRHAEALASYERAVGLKP